MGRRLSPNINKQLIYENEHRTRFTAKDEAAVRFHLRVISDRQVERFTREQADFCLRLIKRALLPRVLKEMLSDVVEKNTTSIAVSARTNLGLNTSGS